MGSHRPVVCMTVLWPQISARLIIGSVGVTSFWLPFLFFPQVPLDVMIPLSSLLYAATLILFKKTRQCEVRVLMNILKWGPG